jgi:hypothetical protein
MKMPAPIARTAAHLLEKPESQASPAHQVFIRSLPCIGCGKPAPSECANVRTRAASICYVVPLCGPSTVWDDCCHSRQHDRGASRFWSELGIDRFDLAARLSRVSGDREAGEAIVGHARQAIARQQGDVPEAAR